MPKHIHSDHYFAKPYELFPKGNIHPEIEHRPPTPNGDEEGHSHYLLPAVFVVEKGVGVTLQYPGPGVYYITEGEGQYEDTKHPGHPIKVSAGAVIHIEAGSVIHWSTCAAAKGFSVFHVPISVKGFDEFVVRS